MDYIKKQIEEVIAKIDECQSLVKDQEIVQTKSLKCVIDDMQHQLFGSLKETCMSIQKYIDETKAKEAAMLAEEQKPIYFDIMQQSGAILPHIKDYVLVGKDKIIRSYNKHNKVVFEDAQLAAKCVDYNDMYRLAEEKIKKIISKGRLGLTTKFEAPVEDNDYLEEKYKKMIDSIQLPDDEKLPESFIDAVNRAASEPTKLEPKDEPKDGPMEQEARVPGKAVLDKLLAEGNKHMKAIVDSSDDEVSADVSTIKKQSKKEKGKKSKKDASKAAK